MEKIIIVGCGQHANVVLYNIKCQGIYEVLGFFDANPLKLNQWYYGFRMIEWYKENDLKVLREKYKTNKFFIGFGDMKYRKKVYDEFVNAGWEAVNIYHPDAIISDDAKIGNGVLIEAGCLITPNPIIGNNVVINTGTQVNHDNVIEDHVYVASGVILSGGVIIKENSLLDDGVIVTLGKTVGKNCIVGAGSVVTKNIEDNIIAYGNPARAMRVNESF